MSLEKYEIEELIERTEIDFDTISDGYDLYIELDHDGSVHELIDSAIDIYNYDLRKWSVENYNYIEDAMSEGLCEGSEDFHKLIQMGQYIYYRELAQELCKEIFNDKN